MTAARLLGVMAACAVVVGCEKKDDPPPPPRPVLSMLVDPIEDRSVAVAGMVQPQFKTDFGFRMIGRLIARPVNVGEVVEKDQLLAAVDPFAAELQVRSALAQLSTAQGQLANASGNAERQRALIETGATTKATLDTAEQGGSAAQAAVIRAQSDLTKAREQLSYTRLNADYAGVVMAISAEVGQMVADGQTVVTVARPDVREAVIDVADDMARAVNVGMQLTVQLQLDPRIRVQGKIREIGPQSDVVTRSRRIRITLEAPPETFRLGTTITVLIPGAAVPGLRLPESAIRAQNGKSNVWLIDPATKSVTAREVQVVSSQDGQAQVTGLDAGARVVVAGVYHLKEGQKVRMEQDPVQ